MIKKILIATMAIFFIPIFCSSQIIRKATEGEIANYGIPSSAKTVFFVENRNVKADDVQLKSHNESANHICNLYGIISEGMMIRKINAKTFKFSKGKKAWFLDTGEMPSRTAMILYNGSKPIIEYDSEKYLPMIKKYLSDDLKKMQERNAKIKKEENLIQTVIDSLWAIDFRPDEKYAESVIKNLKRNYSPAVFGFSFMKCDGTIFTQIFTDLAQKQLSYTSKAIYEDGKLVRDQYEQNAEASGQNRYFSSLGLLDSVAYHQNYRKKGEILFKYLPDRIISRENKNLSRDEYLLNDNFQIFKKIGFDEGNKATSEQYFFYDNLGRLIRVADYSSRKKSGTTFYEYETQEQERFSKMKIVYENDNDVYENTNTIIDGKETFINTKNGKIQSKIVSYTDKNCEGKTLMYDGFNAITYVLVQKKIIYECE